MQLCVWLKKKKNEFVASNAVDKFTYNFQFNTIWIEFDEIVSYFFPILFFNAKHNHKEIVCNIQISKRMELLFCQFQPNSEIESGESNFNSHNWLMCRNAGHFNWTIMKMRPLQNVNISIVNIYFDDSTKKTDHRDHQI